MTSAGQAQRPLMFQAGGLSAQELSADDVPLVQALFDANPLYFQTVNHRHALPDEAQQEFDEYPPASMSFTRRWFAGLFDAQGQAQGVLVVVSDLVASGVWHITLMLLADSQLGRGVAQAVFAQTEDWARQQGARWLRLAVVQGNLRGQRFWAACGFQTVRVRPDVDTGGRLNSLEVMVKPLGDETIAGYLALVPRDRPAAPA